MRQDDKDLLIENLLAARGTTLCLGLQRSLFSSIVDADWLNKEDSGRLLYIPVHKIDKPIMFGFFIAGQEWKVVAAPSRHHFHRNVAYIQVEELLSDLKMTENSGSTVDSDSMKAFRLLIASLYVHNIWMLDGFPYQSHEFNINLTKIEALSQGSGIISGVTLITGLHKFGSTDISTEEEAIADALKRLSRRNMSSMSINKNIAPDQIPDFFSPDSVLLKERLKEFKDDCTATLENLKMIKDILAPMLMIRINMSKSEYVKEVMNILNSFTAMLPVVKYLDKDFYKNFENKIEPIFNNIKESEIMKCTNRCINTLFNLLIQWIN